MSIEHEFGDIDTAIKELGRLGFSLNGFVQEKYRVVPREIPDDYPTMINSKKPRAFAFVTVRGTLIIDEIPDQNPVLIRYKEMLTDGLTERMKK